MGARCRRVGKRRSVSNTCSLATARSQHTATLLPSGRVLVTGGDNFSGVLNSAELYLYDLGINSSRRLMNASVSSPVTPGGSITLSGTGFIGDSEAASGSNNQSATSYPLVQLRRVDNAQIAWAAPAPASTRYATSYQSSPLPAVTSLPPGPCWLTVIVNGLASNAVPINVVVLSPSTTVLSSSAAPSSFGLAVTFTATGSSSPAPTGNVSFCDGGAVSDASFCQTGTLVCANAAVSTPASVTSATSTNSALATGTHAITARYSGDGNNLPSTATTFSQGVNPASQTISFGAAPTLVFGGTGTVTATATSGLAVSFTTSRAARARSRLRPLLAWR